MTSSSELGWLRAAGTPHDIGHALGQAGQAAVRKHLLRHPLWREATDPVHAKRVTRMASTVRRLFPWIHAEITGLAAGLDLPFDQVMAWNCRGDILASVADGCTSVMSPGQRPMLAHNEDGFPFLRGHAFIAELEPNDAPKFIGFCYPGSIPGHTFAFNSAGLAQTVNNIRLTGIEAEIPRMVLGRAVLAARSVADALAILRAAPASGGFHFALAECADARVWSVEFGAGQVSATALTAKGVHANHVLHLPYGLARQAITQSSADRQVRAEALLQMEAAPLMILQDKAGPGLPIRRDDPQDPDEENTLATAIFTLGERGIDWRIHSDAGAEPTYRGCLPVSES